MIDLISFFSGAGGLDLGFELMGFNPIIAYDKEKVAVETYNYNRKREIARVVDISKLSVTEIIHDIEDRTNLNNLRGILGGPPCQYFSNGNNSIRKKDDPRRFLPRVYAKLLGEINNEINLDFFVFENVPGLTQKLHKDDFMKIIEMFENSGFTVFSKILNAYDFNVAQKRKRIFLVGWNKKIYPRINYQFPIGEPSGLTVRDIIFGLVEPEYWKANSDPEKFPLHPNHWTMNPKSDKFANKGEVLTGGTRSFRKLSWDKPSYTVAYGHNEIHVHPDGYRRLSIYEAMLLQGFPKDRVDNGYQLLGNLSQQVTLISDVVPPPIGVALAKSIKGYLV